MHQQAGRLIWFLCCRHPRSCPQVPAGLCAGALRARSSRGGLLPPRLQHHARPPSVPARAGQGVPGACSARHVSGSRRRPVDTGQCEPGCQRSTGVSWWGHMSVLSAWGWPWRMAKGHANSVASCMGHFGAPSGHEIAHKIKKRGLPLWAPEGKIKSLPAACVASKIVS